MEKGIAENDLDEIQAAKKMIELAQETQKKAQDEFRAVHGEKRKINEKLGERAFKKLKKNEELCCKKELDLCIL